MQISRLKSHKGMRAAYVVLTFAIAAGIRPAALKPNESGNRALYGKPIQNSEIVDSNAPTSPVAPPLLSELKSLLHTESATQ